MKFPELLKKPSAYLPLAMSVAAIATVIIHVVVVGAARESDEGTAAHIWQLLMAGQLPILAFFAVKWLPHSPQNAFMVMALQAAAALAALAPVYFLHW